MEHPLEHRLEHPPRPVCRTNGKKGGVAPVLPRTPGAAHSGLAVASKLLLYNKVRKLAMEHPTAVSWNPPPLTLFQAAGPRPGPPPGPRMDC